MVIITNAQFAELVVLVVVAWHLHCTSCVVKPVHNNRVIYNQTILFTFLVRKKIKLQTPFTLIKRTSSHDCVTLSSFKNVTVISINTEEETPSL